MSSVHQKNNGPSLETRKACWRSPSTAVDPGLVPGLTQILITPDWKNSFCDITHAQSYLGSYCPPIKVYLACITSSSLGRRASVSSRDNRVPPQVSVLLVSHQGAEKPLVHYYYQGTLHLKNWILGQFEPQINNKEEFIASSSKDKMDVLILIFLICWLSELNSSRSAAFPQPPAPGLQPWTSWNFMAYYDLSITHAYTWEASGGAREGNIRIYPGLFHCKENKIRVRSLLETKFLMPTATGSEPAFGKRTLGSCCPAPLPVFTLEIPSPE